MPRDLRLTRYDAPEDLRLTRFAPSPVDARRTSGAVVGAPPFVVSWGMPGARDEVYAYGQRVAAAWEEFWSKDFGPWSGLAFSGSGTVIGDVLGGGADAKASADAIAKITNDRRAFEAFRADVLEPTKAGVFGPSPSEAWQSLQLFEATLRSDVALFAKVSGRKPIGAPPATLEDPGGKPREGIPWGGILAVGGAIAVAWGLSSAVRLAKE